MLKEDIVEHTIVLESIAQNQNIYMINFCSNFILVI